MTLTLDILVIADDLTGAAEIAGIAHRHGLPTRLVRSPPSSVARGVTVLDTHSRSLPARQAAAAVAAFLRPLTHDAFHLVYKKTDSALRGPILAELDAVMSHFRRTAALLLPQNPSRGRTIAGAHYHVDSVPLHRTPFAADPEHPARTSHAPTLLGPCAYLDTAASPARGVTLCGASTTDDVREWTTRLSPVTLPAGSADFFTAILRHRLGLGPGVPFDASPPPRPVLHVCGTTHASHLAAGVRESHVPVFPLTDDRDRLATAIAGALTTRPHVLLSIDRPLDTTPGAPASLHASLADTTAAVLARTPVSTVLAEGGATAAALAARLDWTAFDVRSEIAPGVVALRPAAPASPTFVLKPGSYRWPDSVFQPTGYP